MELTAKQKFISKIIAVIYIFGGLVGTIFIVPQIFYISFDLTSAFAYVFLVLQIIVALFGGWKLWNSQKIGMLLLSWLSIPLIETSLIVYRSVFGIGITPTLLIADSSSGFNLAFHFGYDGSLFFLGDIYGFTIGINIVAIIMLGALAKIMKGVDIKSWPFKTA